MTPEQKRHLNEIMDTANSEIRAKYERGCLEHKGLLSDASSLALVNMALEEAYDSVVYLLTLREKLLQELAE